MDFPKGCSSNVHVIESLAQTRFRRYAWKDEQILTQQRRRLLQEILTSLREQNVLCARDEGGVWVFGDLGQEPHDHLVASSLSVEEEGKIEDHAARQDGGRKLAKDVLLDAIEGAIAFRLAKSSHSVRLAPWTWLYTRSDGEETDVESTAMRLHTRFAPNGALYLVPQLFTSPWIPADMVPTFFDVDILMAPSGTFARAVQNHAGAEDVVSGTAWHSEVQKALQTEGILIEEDEDWLTVQLSDDAQAERFEWPARLCFVHSNIIQKRPSLGFGNEEWRSWFSGVSTGVGFRNPLATAEQWFVGAEARERAAQQATQMEFSMNGVDESLGSASANMPTNGNDPNLATSPMFNQRNLDQQAAMAGIYPTPPDGLTQSQQMPNINAVSTPSVVQADQGPGVDLLTTSDDVQFKGNDFTSSAEPETYQLGQEDLFGDVGEMEFGDHEVDDADFNFFDEPDEDPVAAPVEDTEMSEAPVPPADNTTGQADGIEAQNSVTEYQDSENAMAEPTPEDTAVSADSTLLKPDKLRETEADFASNGPLSESQLAQPEKPLSPFGIRERLLPPPVPASVAQNQPNGRDQQRRSSNFSPIAFRDSSHLESKYSEAYVPTGDARLGRSQPAEPDIALPSTRKKSRLLKMDDDSEDSESEEESFDSESSENEQKLPPKLPWDNRKRKRHINHDSANSFAWLEMSDMPDVRPKSEFLEATVIRILESAMMSQHELDFNFLREGFQGRSAGTSVVEPTAPDPVTSIIPFIEDMYDLRKDDLVCIAQVIGEVSITAFETTAQGLGPASSGSSPPSIDPFGSEMPLRKTLVSLFPDAEMCDLGKVALTREPPPRPGANQGKAPQGQPRPPQRADSMMMMGPDYFPLPAPYVRIQRGADNWEMLPTSLSFWEPLGLGPASGPKKLRAFCIFPFNDDLQHLVEQFIVDLGTAFESCKLGSHVHLRNVIENEELDNYEDGMAPVELGEDVSLPGVLRAYANASSELGKALSSISYDESDKTIVIYMVNPFEEQSAVQHLCACFWLLFKAYRDNLPKTRRNQCVGDIVLQIIPISAIASFDGIVVPDSKQMAALAREVYDRCPPSNTSQPAETMSPLPILVAPSVELAGQAPKRIGFQLTAEPPGDLLHEGSVLHLAYTVSCDGQWLTAAWLDSTGQHQSTISFCLRGRSFADVAEEAWDRTREIMAARQVTWRIFIITSECVDRAVSQCWRALSSRPRPQPLCVTLLSAQTDPALKLFPPAGDQPGKDAQDAGFLTPASTPQGNNFTSSPDVTGHTTAPLTPAPSETAASIAENDPDAHLTDITDETWGVLLSPKLTHLASNTGLANGILFKRGDVDTTPIGAPVMTGEKLPSLGVSLHWTIQVKPSGGVDEGSIRQAELTLRELLKLYRNLALLTRARGLEREGCGVVPLHVAMAMRAAEGLNGMLAPVTGS